MFGKKKQGNKPLKIKCPKCGDIVSTEAMKKAEEKSRKKLEDAMRKYGTINITGDWEIKCGGCGKKIVYSPNDGKVK